MRLLAGALCVLSAAVSARATVGTIDTIAGTGTAGIAGDGGPAIAAELNHPRQLAVDAAGNVFVAEVDNHRVRRIDPGGTISSVAGTTAGFSGDLGPATAAQLRRPVDVAVDTGGNVFVADLDNHRIRRIDAVTGIITTVAGTTGGFSGDGGPATAAQLFAPYSIAVDTGGNLFIGDLGNQRVRRVDAVSGIITTVAGTGTPGFSGDGGPAIAADLYQPIDVVVDGAGTFLVADFSNQRVRRIDGATGVITTVLGTGTAGTAGDGGLGTAAETAGPVGLTFDMDGSLFVVELDNRRVRRIDAASGLVFTVAGTGAAGTSGDGGPATAATMEGPFGAALAADGALLVADRLGHQIRRAAVVPAPCPGGAPADRHRLRVRNLHTALDDDRLSLRGLATLPFPFAPALDPQANGVRVVVTDFAESAVLLDAVVAPGASWRTNGPGTAWTFGSGGTAEGITAVAVRTNPAHPGLVRFKVKGTAGGRYGAMRVPVAAFVGLDASAPPSAPCVVARWPALPPASPSCAVTPGGRELRCD
jgi:sugar lactone lactonase YvrE